MNDLYSQGRKALDKDEYSKALEIFKEGICNGETKCFYGVAAATAALGKDISEAVAELKTVFTDFLTQAEENDAEACFIVGRCYETDILGEPKKEKAAKYYEKAIRSNHSGAMFNLGCMMIQNGEDICSVAQKYFLPSAQLNNKNAQYALGFFFEQQQDRENALFWYRIAAEDGSVRMKQKYFEFMHKI